MENERLKFQLATLLGKWNTLVMQYMELRGQCKLNTVTVIQHNCVVSLDIPFTPWPTVTPTDPEIQTEQRDQIEGGNVPEVQDT